MHKTIWEVAHNAIFDAWQSKVWFGKAATWVEIAGVQNLPLRHTFYTSLISSNAFHRQISVSGDLLLWLRIAFGGGFSFNTKRKPYNMGLFIHCCRSWRGGDAFLKLVLIMGQVVLDAFSHLRF